MRYLFIGLATLLMAAPAYALPINSPVPSNAYIS